MNCQLTRCASADSKRLTRLPGGLSIDARVPDARRTPAAAQLRAANRLGARYVLIIGETELQKKQLTLKDMEGGQQEEIDLDEAVEKICQRLARSTPVIQASKGC